MPPSSEKRHPRRQHSRDDRNPSRDRRSDNRRRDDRPARSEPQPLPPLDCTIELHAESLDKLAVCIRESHKAHPFFDVARNVFARPHHLRFSIAPKQDAKIKFHCCVVCGEPFLDAASVIEHHLYRHAEAMFAMTETVLEPPKGNFTLVASCGACDETLCPPNFHRYTELLVAHHQLRHKGAPFDDFKARVRMSRDPQDIETWKKSLSTRQEFQCKHCEKKIPSRAEFAAHAATEHASLLEKIEDRLDLTGEMASDLKCGDLRRVVANALRQERRMSPENIGKLRRVLNVHKLQFFRNAVGHQFINCVQPRLPQTGDITNPLSAEIFRLASAPARRGHKPTRKTLLEHFGAKSEGVAPVAPATSTVPNSDNGSLVPPASTPPSESDVMAVISDLVRAGFIVEYLDGELDAPSAAKADTSALALEESKSLS